MKLTSFTEQQLRQQQLLQLQQQQAAAAAAAGKLKDFSGVFYLLGKFLIFIN